MACGRDAMNHILTMWGGGRVWKRCGKRGKKLFINFGVFVWFCMGNLEHGTGWDFSKLSVTYFSESFKEFINRTGRVFNRIKGHITTKVANFARCQQLWIKFVSICKLYPPPVDSVLITRPSYAITRFCKQTAKKLSPLSTATILTIRRFLNNFILNKSST